MHELFTLKLILFHISGNTDLLHEQVVLFRNIAGIGNSLVQRFTVMFNKRVEEQDYGECISGELKLAEVKDKLFIASSFMCINVAS